MYVFIYENPIWKTSLWVSQTDWIYLLLSELKASTLLELAFHPKIQFIMVLLVLRSYKLYVSHPTMNVTFLTYSAQLRSTSVPSTVEDHNTEKAFISTTNRLQNLFWVKLLTSNYISRCSIDLYTDCSIFRLLCKYIKSDSVETSK